MKSTGGEAIGYKLSGEASYKHTWIPLPCLLEFNQEIQIPYFSPCVSGEVLISNLLSHWGYDLLRILASYRDLRNLDQRNCLLPLLSHLKPKPFGHIGMKTSSGSQSILPLIALVFIRHFTSCTLGFLLYSRCCYIFINFCSRRILKLSSLQILDFFSRQALC